MDLWMDRPTDLQPPALRKSMQTGVSPRHSDRVKA